MVLTGTSDAAAISSSDQPNRHLQCESLGLFVGDLAEQLAQQALAVLGGSVIEGSDMVDRFDLRCVVEPRTHRAKPSPRMDRSAYRDARRIMRRLAVSAERSERLGKADERQLRHIVDLGMP